MAEPELLAPAWSDSRRLFGPSRWLDAPGVVLEGFVDGALAATAADVWCTTVQRLAAALGWPAPTWSVTGRAGHLVLAFTAPGDQLLTATEVNEWAWESALRAAGVASPPLFAPGDLPRDEALVVRQLAVFAALEAQAPSSDLAVVARPDQRVALVTGSNGKTTTTRLIAAMTMATGHHTGWCCTDGVFIDGAAVEAGDWSGPAGAQRVVHAPAVQCAILETARGGILRRGLGVLGASVAVVTNIEADHFGEYGVETLADLADVKLVIAKGLRGGGVLVLNADDAVLHAATLPAGVMVAWYSPSGTTRWVGERPVSAWRDADHLWLASAQGVDDLGDLRAMPLTAAGAAEYNLTNMLAAALAAHGLGVPVATITDVLARFGAHPADNAGRLSRFALDGATILLDYAHNPTGLTGLLKVATSLRPVRLLLLLGQAGNRDDGALADLADAAWTARPDRIVLKELDGYRRGRTTGEVPALLAHALLALGAPAERIVTVLDEVDAVEAAIRWAQPGDVLVLPVHSLDARAAVLSRLAALGATAAN
jgi:UDP-N-acetylmuramyl tripeptide synthase